MEQYLHKDLVEAGVDEVGRGCLSGPVFAAAVILPKDFKSDIIKDSKKLTEKGRLRAYEEIKENAIDISIHSVSPQDIDKHNIQNAVYASMNGAIDGLKIKPEHVLVDGNNFDSYTDIPYTCIVKGDDKYLSIASASIVAKVTRDEYMKKLHEDFPIYHWDKNKGYGSKHHIDIIKEQGITHHHRKTFLKKILNA